MRNHIRRAVLGLTAVAVLGACSAGAPTIDVTDELGSGPVAVETMVADATSMPDPEPRSTTLASFGRFDETDAVPQDPSTGSPDETEPLPAVTPTQVIERMEAQLDIDQPAPGSDGTELLSAVEPLDHKPLASQTLDLRAGVRMNETGERNVFDESASLACADIEVALTDLDEGRLDAASGRIGSAADRAEASRVATISEWHPVLSDVVSTIDIEGRNHIPPLLAFLSTCTQGGYEL